jgi:uncharacterized protein (DUF885 family)
VNPELKAIADEYWEHFLTMNPMDAHIMGDYRFIGKYSRADKATEDANIATHRDMLARTTAIDATGLSADDRTTREALIYHTRTKSGILEMRQREFGIDPIFGPQASIHMLVPNLTIETAEHADAMLDTYVSYSEWFDQSIERLREGLLTGRVNAEFAIASTLEQLDSWLATPIDQDSLLNANLPASFSDAERDAWMDKAKAIIASDVRPALERYRTVIADEIAPVARPNERAGLWALPDGDLLYGRLLEKYTTFPMHAEEIHQIGLDQIGKLAGEYKEYGPAAVGSDNVEEIFAILKTDKSITHSSGPDIVAVCEEAFDRARAEMGNWFGRVPVSDCRVQETSHGALAYYFEPAEDGTRPGTFFMNTADPTAWGVAEVEGTAFHEGIPGHHMQIAIAQELGDSLPSFRSGEFISAYGEGWALYTERLSQEMGLYSGPLALLGMLQNDSMRSCRLVVDTGMHALGWSRQQGIDYMAANSPMSMHQIVGEIDRYLSFPGQAVSYMIGRLEIDRMRRQAEAELGNAFDIKGFHDAVIGSGCVPLSSLDRIVSEWTVGVGR